MTYEGDGYLYMYLLFEFSNKISYKQKGSKSKHSTLSYNKKSKVAFRGAPSRNKINYDALDNNIPNTAHR
jgi:hypothetical protein